MTYAISLDFDDGRESSYEEFVGYRTFNEVWLEASKRLSLHWIQEFSWLVVERDKVSEIVAELQKLNDWFSKNQDPASQDGIKKLILTLHKFEADSHASATIGG